MVTIPTSRAVAMNRQTRRSAQPTSPTVIVPAFAKLESTTRMMTAAMSSTMRIPRITCANTSRSWPVSIRTCTMMVVELMESRAPKNRLSIGCRPRNWPAV